MAKAEPVNTSHLKLSELTMSRKDKATRAADQLGRVVRMKELPRQLLHVCGHV